jgi:hypothetical protein
MDSLGLSVPIDILRDAVRGRVEASSYRDVVAETGVSKTALRHFLSPESEGSTLYSENRRKLTEWYLRTVPDQIVHAALAALVAALPPETRERGSRELLAIIRRCFDEARVTLPTGWSEQGR